MQPKLAQFQAQGLPGDSQEPRCLVLITLRIIQNQGEQDPIYLAVDPEQGWVRDVSVSEPSEPSFTAL